MGKIGRALREVGRRIGGPSREFKKLFTRNNEFLDLPVRPEAEAYMFMKRAKANLRDAALMVILLPVVILMLPFQAIGWILGLFFGRSDSRRRAAPASGAPGSGL